MKNNSCKMVLPGGAGFLGRTLSTHFATKGFDVVVLSRRAANIHGARVIRWDGETSGDWFHELESATAVVNLAGRSVNCRYNKKNKREIYDSRLKSTRVLGQAIASCKTPPRLWINSSSATIYRHAEDRDMDEDTGEIGEGFSVDVCQKWEKELFDANVSTRRIALRLAMTFGAQAGGVADVFLDLARKGLAGTLGPGTQYMSWIHAEDFARAIEWFIQHEELDGAINCSSPHPLQNREFMKILRAESGAKLGLPATNWMLEIGSFFMQTETELSLKSRRVVPTRLLESGFTFQYPTWREAIREIVNIKQQSEYS
jgi:uncharacterized protein (TIGR01777 family)